VRMSSMLANLERISFVRRSRMAESWTRKEKTELRVGPLVRTPAKIGERYVVVVKRSPNGDVGESKDLPTPIMSSVSTK
jgi:hypothetical protein